MLTPHAEVGVRAHAPIHLDTPADLKAHEKEIVKRINAAHNGGLLFLAHPFMLLAELGISMSDALRRRIVERTPALASLSEAPYHALLQTRDKQRVAIRVHGLFEGIR